MDFGLGSGNGGLLNSVDARIHKTEGTTGEDLGQPKLPVSLRERHEQTTSAFGQKAPTAECTPAPFPVGLRRSIAGQTTSVRKPSPHRRTLAIGNSPRIAIKAKGKILFLDVADVIAVEAKGNYVSLLHTSTSHVLRESISTMEEKLNLHGFVRIHRSVLVNAALVEEIHIHPRSTGDYVLRVRGGKEFTVSRTYKSNLQLLAQLWIGMEGFGAE